MEIQTRNRTNQTPHNDQHPETGHTYRERRRNRWKHQKDGPIKDPLETMQVRRVEPHPPHYIHLPPSFELRIQALVLVQRPSSGRFHILSGQFPRCNGIPSGVSKQGQITRTVPSQEVQFPRLTRLPTPNISLKCPPPPRPRPEDHHHPPRPRRALRRGTPNSAVRSTSCASAAEQRSFRTISSTCRGRTLPPGRTLPNRAGSERNGNVTP